ncbi:hypothetical protein GSY74_02840 [Sulfurovum sp. bin170]|uniref:hypothetical protein n=1 Tax=Sulfurovum sp. bin170 TaxID=2695268 RepID=UPI0013DEA99C|nr:hypothetical protein [Sulfurovum sp. bin170]NEW60209.1 hypothetical protein [Sulfurovum sp. bin170]
MFNQGGLSLEQAPPISVVLRFFITASAFGVLLGLYLMGDFKNSVVIHILAVGIMASFMLGALFQMLPVIAGVAIKAPIKKALVAHILLVIGLITQILAFNNYSLFTVHYSLISAILLGSGLLHASTLMLKEIIKIKDHSSSSKGMLFALASFLIAIVLGIYLLLTLGGYNSGTLFMEIKEAHYSFAIFGWITLLIISISFQVIEMFYITPKYPKWISKYLTVAIFTLLILKTIALLASLSSNIIDIFLATLFIIYAGVTIHRLYKRKRPTSDATVWFWRLGMGLLTVSMSIVLIDNITTLHENMKFISQVTFIGFALSIVFAMVYKIVPFLVWFHLSNQGYMEAPMMFDVIHPKKAKIHFRIHIAMLITFVSSTLLESKLLFLLASLLVTISFGWLLYHLIFAVKKYNYTQKHTKKIEW